MMWSDRKTTVSKLAVLLALVFAAWGPQTELCAEKRVEFRRVFEFKPKAWRDWPLAVLTPQGDQIHFLSGPILQVIDRATHRVIAKTDYSGLPCTGPKEFRAWEILPERKQIVAAYCNRLLLVIDSYSFKVERQLGWLPHEYVGVRAVSPDGLRAVIEVYGTDQTGFHSRVVFFDTRTWTEEKSWTADAQGLAFSDDGTLLVFQQHRLLSDTEARCGIEVREVGTGKVYSDWWPTRKWRSSPTALGFVVDDPGCPNSPVFLPGRKDQIAAGFPMSITIWDFEKRDVIREFKSERPIGQFVVSPDGTLLIADVANIPERTPGYKQDFIVWDIDSGKVVYESSREDWSLLEKLRSPFLRTELFLSGFSADGKYLLTTRHKRITLYEIIR